MRIIETKLEKHGLAKTSQRIEVLSIFMRHSTAISHNSLEKELGKRFDRTTIYRTLNTFQQKGLIHKIISPAGEACYALCSSDCNSHNHKDTHIHFSCINCGNIYCLNETETPQLKLPKGFELSSFNSMAEGLCKSCRLKNDTVIKLNKAKPFTKS